MSDEARKILTRFADASRSYAGGDYPGDYYCDEMQTIKVGDLRAAARALANPSPPHTEPTSIPPVARPDPMLRLAKNLWAAPYTYAKEATEVLRKLSDPAAVHFGLLTGRIAKPSIENIIHLYGAEALQSALSKDPLIPHTIPHTSQSETASD